jgi:hypothetical protein
MSTNVSLWTKISLEEDDDPLKPSPEQRSDH